MAGAFTSDISVMEYECEHYIIPDFKGADFLIRVKGDSMQPTYYSGDLVACQKISMSDIFFQWNKTYVLDTDQGPLIKRVLPSQNNNSTSLLFLTTRITLHSNSTSRSSMLSHSSEVSFVWSSLLVRWRFYAIVNIPLKSTPKCSPSPLKPII